MSKGDYNLRAAKERGAVFTYVKHHPGTTVRNVAVAVFGGTGKRGSYELSRARLLLHELEAAGVVRRVFGHLPKVGHRTPDHWFAVD